MVASKRPNGLTGKAKWAILGILGVIGAGIGSACSDWIADKIKGVGILDAVWSWLTTPHAMTFSTLGWIGIGIVAIFVLWGVRTFELPKVGPWYLTFTKMRWRGVLWEWRYNGNRLHFPSITPYCPECNTRITPQDVGAYRTVPRIQLACERCSRQFGQPFPGDEDELQRQVFLEYERRCRNRSAYASQEAMENDDRDV